MGITWHARRFRAGSMRRRSRGSGGTSCRALSYQAVLGGPRSGRNCCAIVSLDTPSRAVTSGRMPSILEQLPRVPLLSDIPIPFLDRVPLLDRALLMMQMMPALVSAAQLQWNDSASVADRIEDQAERLGDKPFVFFEERWLTYRQWNEAAN